MFSGPFPKNGFSVELSKFRFFLGLVAFSDSGVLTGLVGFMEQLVYGHSNLGSNYQFAQRPCYPFCVQPLLLDMPVIAFQQVKQRPFVVGEVA